jgi:hypothetical protein
LATSLSGVDAGTTDALSLDDGATASCGIVEIPRVNAFGFLGSGEV